LRAGPPSDLQHCRSSTVSLKTLVIAVVAVPPSGGVVWMRSPPYAVVVRHFSTPSALKALNVSGRRRHNRSP
jgi:hypothetical protein